MNNDSFVKIEDKKMPICDFNYPDLEQERNYSKGFTNLVFLSGIIVTFFMWIMLIFFRK